MKERFDTHSSLPDMLPCPFCGSKDIDILWCEDGCCGSKSINAECKGCGAYGPYGDGNAIELWNIKRT